MTGGGCSSPRLLGQCSQLLLQLEEHGYKSIDPMLVRLPRPQPPSKRLLEAVEEFYEAASDDRPRNE